MQLTILYAASAALKSVRVGKISTPPQRLPAYQFADGKNHTGLNLSPGIVSFASLSHSRSESIHGAPIISKGFVELLPTEILTPSKYTVTGYSSAALNEGRLG